MAGLKRGVNSNCRDAVLVYVFCRYIGIIPTMRYNKSNCDRTEPLPIKKLLKPGGAIWTRKVIFIMTDTQRTDMLGCYGHPDMKTPSLDRLAQEGIRFEKAYTTQPVCQPARSAIFTGSYPHSCAGWSNCMGLSDNVQNIGRRLTDQGIHSAYIGKWHLDGGDYFGLGRCATAGIRITGMTCAAILRS